MNSEIRFANKQTDIALIRVSDKMYNYCRYKRLIHLSNGSLLIRVSIVKWVVSGTRPNDSTDFDGFCVVVV